MKPEVRPESPQARWEAYLEEFNRQNARRLTRLGVVRAGGKAEDFWLEDRLPLAAVSLDAGHDRAPQVEIMLRREGAPGRSITHTVPRVSSLVIRLTPDGLGDGLNVEDEGGATTLLRFEPRPME
jgi:hypothetical protein